MAAPAQDVETRARFTTPEEGRELFDFQARELLGMSGEEFLNRWDTGEFRNLPDIEENFPIIRLAMLIPFARQDR